MARRILFFLALSILQLFPLTALYAETPKETVVVAQFGKEKFLLYLPFYIAMEEGLFAKRGLEIDLRFAGNDDQIFATVISGSALFGVGDPVFAAIAKDRGGPGKIVAMMIIKLGLSGYTNKKEVPDIHEPTDLKGLRIASLPKPATTYTLLTEIIRKFDLAATGTTLVEAAIGGQLAVLEAGQADMAVDLEPTVSLVESKGYRVNALIDKFTDSQAITGLSTLETTIENRPDLVQKMVSALQEAMVLFYSDKNIAFRVSKRLFPTLDDQVINNALKRMVVSEMYPRSVVVGDSYWQRSLKTRLDSGELKKPQATSVTVDNSFAEKARKEFGL